MLHEYRDRVKMSVMCRWMRSKDMVVFGTAGIARTLGDGLLAVTTAAANAIDNVALLGLVAETTSLVGARGTRSTVDYVQLTVFPAPADLPFKHIDKLFHSRNVPNAEQESEDIRLLLFVQLAYVLVGSHLAG